MIGAVMSRWLDRRLVALIVAGLLLASSASAGAMASTGPGADAAPSSALQATLDQVLGRGNSTVVVSDIVRTSTTTTTSVRWGTGVPRSVTDSRVAADGLTTTSIAQQNALGRTRATIVTPPGGLVRRTVAVVVNRSSLRTAGLPALRRLVTASAGLSRSRGDRLSIVVTRFPNTSGAQVAAVTPIEFLLPFAVPAIWILGGLLALGILAWTVRGGKIREARKAA